MAKIVAIRIRVFPVVAAHLVRLNRSHATWETTSTTQKAGTGAKKIQRALGLGEQKWTRGTRKRFCFSICSCFFSFFSLFPRGKPPNVLVRTQASASDRSRVLARAIPARSASRETSPRGAGGAGAGATRRVGLFDDVAIEAGLALLFAFGLLRMKLGAGGGLPLELRGRDASMERETGVPRRNERARERRNERSTQAEEERRAWSLVFL